MLEENSVAKVTKFLEDLHGVGASVVNALSIYTKVTVHRDGGIYIQEYSQGKKKAASKKSWQLKRLHGTIVDFQAGHRNF